MDRVTTEQPGHDSPPNGQTAQPPSDNRYALAALVFGLLGLSMSVALGVIYTIGFLVSPQGGPHLLSYVIWLSAGISLFALSIWIDICHVLGRRPAAIWTLSPLCYLPLSAFLFAAVAA